ncbi:MAG: phosphonoacetaldehyde hydrolase [Dehalococcoidia bacterium]
MAEPGSARVERPYRGPLRAVILDWAGTVVDYGSRAPAAVFIELFAQHGVTVTMAEARAPMGTHKRAHLTAILQSPGVAKRWLEARGSPPNEGDIDALYDEFVPLQVASLPRYAGLIPGMVDAAAAFRRRGLKIGMTTGYNREMVDVLIDEAKRQGFEPDCAVAADEVPAGRPQPFMCYRNAIELQAYPLEACVKIGDTVPDIDEGLNAGMWTVGLTKTGNEIGLTEEEVAALPSDVLTERLAAIRERFVAAGAHYTIEGIAGVPGLLDEIEARLSRGERP